MTCNICTSECLLWLTVYLAATRSIYLLDVHKKVSRSIGMQYNYVTWLIPDQALYHQPHALRFSSLLLDMQDAEGGLPSLTCHTNLTACCRSFAENNRIMEDWDSGRILMGVCLSHSMHGCCMERLSIYIQCEECSPIISHLTGS